MTAFVIYLLLQDQGVSELLSQSLTDCFSNTFSSIQDCVYITHVISVSLQGVSRVVVSSCVYISSLRDFMHQIPWI